MNRVCLCFALWGATLLAVAGCGEDVCALDISLVPDPNVNDPQALRAQLSTLELVVDSPSGLYPAGMQWRSEIAQLADIDNDGQPELQARIDLAGFDQLPTVRLERGSMPELAIDLRAEGVAQRDGEKIAAGGVQGVGYSPGQAVPVRVLFNIRPRFRPPQVTQTIPAQGAQLGRGQVGSIFVVFSKQMSEPSLKRPGVVQLLRRDAGGEALVPNVGDLHVQSFADPDVPTTAEYRLPNPLDGGRYVIRVSREAEDPDQRQLDQIPMQPGSEGFSAEFEVEGPAEMTAMDPGKDGSAAPTCEQTGCPPGMRCASSGLCLPTVCPDSCEPGTVCDPRYPLCDGFGCEQVPLCVPDCRLHGSYGGCTEQRPVCEPQTGVCRGAV